jgi:hypothetical protein
VSAALAEQPVPDTTGAGRAGPRKLPGMSLLALCLLAVILSFTAGAYFSGRG